MLKIKIKYVLGIIFTLSFIAGCSTTYGPDETIGGFDTGGYTQNRINANTFMISFRANKYTNPELVKRYILYKSALITIENGYDYFIVTSGSFQCYNINTKSIYKTYLTTIPPRYYPSAYKTIQYGSSYPYPKKDRFCDPKQPNNAMAVIKTFNGSLPEKRPGYYDARDIMTETAPYSLED